MRKETTQRHHFTTAWYIIHLFAGDQRMPNTFILRMCPSCPLQLIIVEPTSKQGHSTERALQYVALGHSSVLSAHVKSGPSSSMPVSTFHALEK